MILSVDGLRVACGLDWFQTAFGACALLISLCLAFASAWMPESND